MPCGVIRAAERPASSIPRAQLPAPSDEVDKNVPRRVRITRSAVEKFGPSEERQKCRAIQNGDPGYEAVGHSATCRTRMEELMRQDPELQSRLADSEERRQKLLANYIEKKEVQQSSGEGASKHRREEVSSSAGASSSSRGDSGRTARMIPRP